MSVPWVLVVTFRPNWHGHTARTCLSSAQVRQAVGKRDGFFFAGGYQRAVLADLGHTPDDISGWYKGKVLGSQLHEQGVCNVGVECVQNEQRAFRLGLSHTLYVFFLTLSVPQKLFPALVLHLFFRSAPESLSYATVSVVILNVFLLR